MSDTTVSLADTVPPASPTDKLLGWVILAVTLVGMAATLGSIALAMRGSTIPDVLPQLALQSVTGLVALLAGRGRT